MKRLYFIRHGLSVDNKNGIYSGRVDTPLADEGRLQIQEAAKNMSSLNVDVIISSPYKRTIESAEIIATEINYPLQKIVISNLLSERELGALEGQPYETSTLTDSVEGIETTAELLNRSQEALDWIKTIEADNILVVSHGSIGRALRATVNPANYSYVGSEPLKNGNLTILV